VILAGGLATRCGGGNKALLPLGGRPLLDRIFSVYRQVFEEIILVTNSPREFLGWDAKIVTDIFSERSSLTGIHTGLFYAENPYAFVCACDTPFLKREVVELVLERLRPVTDVALPRTAAGAEPLCAAYSRRCLKPIEQHLNRRLLKIQLALAGCRIETIPETAIRERDPELVSFFNVNTIEDLARAERMLAGAEPGGEPPGGCRPPRTEPHQEMDPA
jgi:molybdopterin-guanine dinucleotide biosynthesis protein A